MKKQRDPEIEIPQGSLGAAFMAAFHSKPINVLLAFAKGSVSIDGEILTSNHMREDAAPYRGCYMNFHGRQALLVGHALVRSDEQLSLT